MNPDTLRQVIELVYQYGPFGFAIIFLYSISRWAYRRYDEASKHPHPNSGQVAATRGVYLASFSFGVVLVGTSVIWWFVHKPIYLFTGKIRDLDHNMLISSDAMYFRERAHNLLGDDDIPLHD